LLKHWRNLRRENDGFGHIVVLSKELWKNVRQRRISLRLKTGKRQLNIQPAVAKAMARQSKKYLMIKYHNTVSIFLRVNGENREVQVRPADTLLQVLRNHLGLTGAKAGCENGDCGACTVLLDGRPVKSCMILAVEAEGAEITTIEGISNTVVQRAFLDEAGYQCGFCTPGFIVNAFALLRAHPDPDKETIRMWLESNLCRCTGYEGIENAIQAAVKALKSTNPKE